MVLFGRRGKAAERRGTPADLLVVGLGNPGPDYAGTRHNVGVEVVEELAGRYGGTLRRSRERADVAEVHVPRPGRPVLPTGGPAAGHGPGGGEGGSGAADGPDGGHEPFRLALAVPHTYMNLSGESVSPLVRRHGITDPGRLVLVHDELDLGTGRVKVKQGGGLAGHNGLKSVASHLHTQDFLRVRVGVGKPPGRQAGRDHVLRRPGRAERADLDVAVAEAADAVELILTDGIEVAMNRYNSR